MGRLMNEARRRAGATVSNRRLASGPSVEEYRPFGRLTTHFVTIAQADPLVEQILEFFFQLIEFFQIDRSIIEQEVDDHGLFTRIRLGSATEQAAEGEQVLQP